MSYQDLQKKQIDELEALACSENFPASIVAPVEDYAHDQRKYLTITGYPPREIVEKMTSSFMADLRTAEPHMYFCEPESLHFTILSIKLFLDGSNFPPEKLTEIIAVTNAVISTHPRFEFHVHGSLALPTSIGVRCYSSETLRDLIYKLKAALLEIGIVPDKKRVSNDILFGNITVSRYLPNYKPTENLLAVVKKYSDFDFGKMEVNSAELIHGNAVFGPDKEKIADYTFS